MKIKDGELEITEVEKISLKKGDVLAIHIDIGNLPRHKAEDYIHECMMKYRGAFPDGIKTLFLPCRDGKKTEFKIIETGENDET